VQTSYLYLGKISGLFAEVTGTEVGQLKAKFLVADWGYSRQLSTIVDYIPQSETKNLAYESDHEPEWIGAWGGGGGRGKL
jgi:hypothetical protein